MNNGEVFDDTKEVGVAQLENDVEVQSVNNCDSCSEAYSAAHINQKFLRSSAAFSAIKGFYRLFWIFIIGSVTGVVVETVYCLIMRQQFENRVGLLFGPFNCVYGMGAVLMTVVLSKLSKERDLWIFLISAIIGGAFELMCSLVQETVFGTVSWEYSHTQFNVAGRTNLLYSFFWGIMGLVFLKDILPRIDKLLSKIKGKKAYFATQALLVFMIINIAITWIAVDRRNARRDNIQPITRIDILLDRYFTDNYIDWKFPNAMDRDEIIKNLNESN